MSRSRKRKPFFAPGKWKGGQSDKFDKQMTHRLFRHRENNALREEQFDQLPLRFDEVRSEWNFNSDGPKTYDKDAEAAKLRK